MIELEYIAAILLTIRIITLHFIFKVLRTQRELMTRPIDAEITGYRKKLYYLTLGLLGSNVIPIIFDTFIIFKKSGVVWADVLSIFIFIFYVVFNVFVALLVAYLIAKIYSGALQVDESHKKSDHTLMND